MIISFKFFLMFQIKRYFYDSKNELRRQVFGAWVSIHTATMQSSKFQESLGRTVAVLPL